MTTEDAAKILVVLQRNWPDRTILEGTEDLWAMVLDDVSYEAAMFAVKLRLKSDNAFFPTPGEIRTVLIEAIMGLPSPEEAWAEVMWAIREHGSYREPLFSCEAICQSVRALGWRNICMSEKIGVEQAHFFRTYQTYRDRAVKNVDLAALTADPTNSIDWSNPVNRKVPTPITATNDDPF